MRGLRHASADSGSRWRRNHFRVILQRYSPGVLTPATSAFSNIVRQNHNISSKYDSWRDPGSEIVVISYHAESITR